MSSGSLFQLREVLRQNAASPDFKIFNSLSVDQVFVFLLWVFYFFPFYSVLLHHHRKQVRQQFAASQGDGHQGSRLRGFSPGGAATVGIKLLARTGLWA